MAASNNKKDDNLGFNISGIKNICSKYKKYIATGAMLILLSVVVSTSRAASNDTAEIDDGAAGTTKTDDTQNGEVEVDAHTEVNELFKEYYQWCAAGDTDKIEEIAFPITDTEKSYIKLLSEYVESYDNIKCYTKNGITDGDYIVMVASEMKFKGIETGVPDLGYFYVRKNETGKAYIDNAYSQFNQTNQENNTDEEINKLITEFLEQDEEMVALKRDTQKEYDKVLEKDEELQAMVTSTFRSAIADWVAGFEPSDEKDGDQSGDQKPSSEESGTQTRTAYAKTRVNMREKRSTSSEVIRTLDPGTEVTIYGTSKDGWFKVKSGGDTGFVSKEYIVSDISKVEKEEEDTDNSSAKTRTAYAKTKVNMREKRSTDSEIIQTLAAGTKVTIYGTSKNGWFKVKCKGKTGFISKEYIVSDKSKVEKEESSTGSSSGTNKRVAYAKTKVNMREKRSTDSEVIRTLKAGTKVMIYGKNKNGWFRIRSNGKFGYVRKEYIVSDKSKVEKEETTQTETPSAPSYYNEGDTITLSDSVNVRTSMSETADRVGLAYKGDVLTVIMSYAEGWTKVSWNGQTGYVKTEFLR